MGGQRRRLSNNDLERFETIIAHFNDILLTVRARAPHVEDTEGLNMALEIIEKCLHGRNYVIDWMHEKKDGTVKGQPPDAR
jgi:hypothetical protein